jgi:antitoxin VapB
MYTHIKIMPTLKSRVFVNGNSQAVRIPQQFKFDTSRVEITKNEEGDLVIHAIPENRGVALLEALTKFDDEFINLLEEEYSNQPAPQEREGL